MTQTAPQGDFDWRGPLRAAGEILYIVLLDAVVVFGIALIASALEFGLTVVNQEAFSWKLYGYELTLKEIVHNGDLFTFLIFMVTAFLHILKWARRQWT